MLYTREEYDRLSNKFLNAWNIEDIKYENNIIEIFVENKWVNTPEIFEILTKEIIKKEIKSKGIEEYNYHYCQDISRELFNNLYIKLKNKLFEKISANIDNTLEVKYKGNGKFVFHFENENFEMNNVIEHLNKKYEFFNWNGEEEGYKSFKKILKKSILPDLNINISGTWIQEFAFIYFEEIFKNSKEYKMHKIYK